VITFLVLIIAAETLGIALLTSKCLEQQGHIERREVHIAELEMILEQANGSAKRTAFTPYPQKGDAP
jgi:hypothetical protein